MTLIPTELPEGLAEDPEVRDAMKQLALAAIEHAIDLLDHGAPSIKLQMIRLLLPSVTKSLQHHTADENTELRDLVVGMYGDMMKQVKT